MNHLPFPIPPTKSGGPIPLWNGEMFVEGELQNRILEYSENFEGWTDELTSLHEESAGKAHPIDLASRADAILEIRSVVESRTNRAVVLEVGCSSGYLLKDIRSQFPDVCLIGADVVRDPLNKLGEELQNVPLMRFDLLKCPIPDNSIDSVVMINVLEHIEDDKSAMYQVARILKPGGKFIIEVPAGPALFDNYDRELQHFRRYRSSTLKAELRKLGFSIDRSSHLAFLIYPAFAFSKIVNKFFAKGTNKVASSRIRKTADSKLIGFMMSLEQKYLRSYSLPFGIRILISASKN